MISGRDGIQNSNGCQSPSINGNTGSYKRTRDAMAIDRLVNTEDDRPSEFSVEREPKRRRIDEAYIGFSNTTEVTGQPVMQVHTILIRREAQVQEDLGLFSMVPAEVLYRIIGHIFGCDYVRNIDEMRQSIHNILNVSVVAKYFRVIVQSFIQRLDIEAMRALIEKKIKTPLDQWQSFSTNDIRFIERIFIASGENNKAKSIKEYTSQLIRENFRFLLRTSQYRSVTRLGQQVQNSGTNRGSYKIYPPKFFKNIGSFFICLLRNMIKEDLPNLNLTHDYALYFGDVLSNNKSLFKDESFLKECHELFELVVEKLEEGRLRPNARSNILTMLRTLFVMGPDRQEREKIIATDKIVKMCIAGMYDHKLDVADVATALCVDLINDQEVMSEEIAKEFINGLIYNIDFKHDALHGSGWGSSIGHVNAINFILERRFSGRSFQPFMDDNCIMKLSQEYGESLVRCPVDSVVHTTSSFLKLFKQLVEKNCIVSEQGRAMASIFIRQQATMQLMHSSRRGEV